MKEAKRVMMWCFECKTPRCKNATVSEGKGVMIETLDAVKVPDAPTCEDCGNKMTLVRTV